jgi:anti-sigma-K factor RskA
MNCEHIDELLGAYVIGAHPEDEAAGVVDHLSTCRRHDDALAGMEAVVAKLPLAAEEREPPPELRSRLLDAFDAEQAAQEAPQRIETARAGLRWRLTQRPAFAYAAAAVLVLAIAGLLSWNLALQFGGDSGSGVNVVAQFSGEAGTGRVVYLPEERSGFVELALREPTEGSVYQAWGIIDGEPVSMGIVPAQGAYSFQADLDGASAMAITEEPPGGSLEPSGDPVAVAPLS